MGVDHSVARVDEVAKQESGEVGSEGMQYLIAKLFWKRTQNFVGGGVLQ